MQKTKLPYYEIFTLLIGEILVSLITAVVYLFTDNFDYKVITGVSLGTLITVFNFLYLSISTTKAINKFLELRNEKGEMTEEESAAFVTEHQAKIQNSIKLSYIIRTLTMLAALVVALLTKQFALIATVIPLVTYRPITMVAALIKRKVVKE